MPWGIAAAAVVGAVGTSVASNKASKAQEKAADTASNTELEQYYQNREDMMPWLTTGTSALNKLAALSGVGTQAPGDTTYGSLIKPFSMADYQADPGYQFRQDQGNQALERSAAARGGLLSGRATKDTLAYSQGLASQEYGAAYDRFNNNNSIISNRLSALAGTGQTAAGTLGANGTATASAIAGNTIGAGNAQAAGYVGAANGVNNGISQGISGYQTNQLMGLLSRNVSSPSAFGGAATNLQR